MLQSILSQRALCLDDAYRQVTLKLRELGLTVFVPSFSNERSPVRDFVRPLHLSGGNMPPEELCVAFVSVEPWTEQRALLFVENFAHLLMQDVRVVFHCAHPVHPLVHYLFEGGMRGRLELMALQALRSSTLSPRDVPELAQQASMFLAQAVGVDIFADTGDAEEALDRLMFSLLRPEAPSDSSLPLEAHSPEGTLVLLGALFGEWIRQQNPDRIAWVCGEGGSYPALQVVCGDMVHSLRPIDRMWRFYQLGESQSLGVYVRALVRPLLSGDRGRQVEKSYGDVVERLFPALKPGSWLKSVQGVGVPLLLEGPVNTPVVVPFVGQGDEWVFPGRTSLESWGVDLQEVLRMARINLVQISRNMPRYLLPFEEVEGISVMRLVYPDEYNAARALLGARLYRAAKLCAPQAEEFLLGIPDQEHLLLCPRGTREEFYSFQRLVRACHENHHAPISSLCFVLGPRGITGYEQAER